MGLQQVPAVRRAVPLTDHDVGMHRRPILLNGDVSQQREHLDLFAENDLLVLLAFRVEESQRNVAQCANCRQARGGEVRFRCEGAQAPSASLSSATGRRRSCCPWRFGSSLMPSTRERFLKSDSAFVQKPFKADDLARKVRDVLRASSPVV
jgi:hypothetical protein